MLAPKQQPAAAAQAEAADVHILHLPSHIVDIIQSSLKSSPADFTGGQGTWQGFHIQWQEVVRTHPLHTQTHLFPSLPKARESL